MVHARIRLTPVSIGTNGIENGITLTTSNQWSETALNWNNQPGGGKRFATWIPAANVPVEFVVTPQVQAAFAGDGQLSLQLFSLSNVGGPGTVTYASREDPDPARRPQLLLVAADPRHRHAAANHQYCLERRRNQLHVVRHRAGGGVVSHSGHHQYGAAGGGLVTG